MIKTIYQSLIATLVLTVILCGVYPLVVWGIGNIFFHDAATGSLIIKDGRIIGSKLIAQGFAKPGYFHSRPSAAGNGYDAANSSGSNLGPTNQKFIDTLKGNIDGFLKDNPSIKLGQVPTDAVTASASGLDPHITPENALAQAERSAQTRKVEPAQIKKVIDALTEDPQFGIFGESVVNVLSLNLELDQKYPIQKQ